jgi:hypothetical protein
MRLTRPVTSWVVYETPATPKMGPMQVVCEQPEWDRLAQDNPDLKLVRAGIATEGEADRVAREATVALRHAPQSFRTPSTRVMTVVKDAR